MRTTSAHRFHHHSMDTLLDNPCMHVLWPTVHQSAFPEAAFWDMSHIHECLSHLLAVKGRLPGCEVSHDLVVILSTVGHFKHQWIHKTSVTTQRVLS